MSGQHRAPRRRRRWLAVLTFPGRFILTRGAAAWGWAAFRVADAAEDALEWLAGRWDDRFGGGDPFADVTLAPGTTSPDPVPAPPGELQEPVQEPLSPELALRVLHGQHPHLPGAHVRWHLFDGAVAGEVHALDADEEGQREIVGQYAAVLAAEMSEHPDGSHVIVAVVGAFADVAFTVAAVLIHDDTMPLPVFDEAAADPTVGDATLTTQHIPERVLAEVVGAR